MTLRESENFDYQDVVFTGTCKKIEDRVYKVNGYTVIKLPVKNDDGTAWVVHEKNEFFFTLKNAKKSLEGIDYSNELRKEVKRLDYMVKSIHKLLQDGKNQLMSVDSEDISIKEALVAFGFTPDGYISAKTIRIYYDTPPCLDI